MSRKSVYLAYLLRHAPQDANLDMDEQGWVPITQLCENAKFTIPELEQIVAKDKKQRYSIHGDKIRANQGHGVPIKIEFKEVKPPKTLYHGTPLSAVDQIFKEGLKPMKRHHVHLSADTTTACKVGARRGHFVLLLVDTEAMVADGHKFFISDNGVYLVNAVHPKYLTKVQHVNTETSP